jgi:hypothetical protein
VPPEFTTGDDELLLGADEDAPVLPVDPVVPVEPVDEEDEEFELPLLPAVDPVDVDPSEPVRVALEPGCSWATTTPIPTVAPAVARRATRVRRLRRAWALSLLAGVLCGLRDI